MNEAAQSPVTPWSYVPTWCHRTSVNELLWGIPMDGYRVVTCRWAAAALCGCFTSGFKKGLSGGGGLFLKFRAAGGRISGMRFRYPVWGIRYQVFVSGIWYYVLESGIEIRYYNQVLRSGIGIRPRKQLKQRKHRWNPTPYQYIRSIVSHFSLDGAPFKWGAAWASELEGSGTWSCRPLPRAGRAARHFFLKNAACRDAWYMILGSWYRALFSNYAHF